MNKIITLLLLATCSTYGMEKSLLSLQIRYIETYKQKCADEGYNFDSYCKIQMKNFLMSPGMAAKTDFYDTITQHMQIPRHDNELIFVTQEAHNAFTVDEVTEIFRDRRI
jgi:hypothetical protein